MRLAIAVLLGAALGVGAALALGGGQSRPESAAPTPGLTRRPAGVGAAFPHTRAGAALAAAAYQQAFADPGVLSAGELRRRVRAVAMPGFAPAMEAANRPGTERLAAGPFGRGIRAGIKSVFLGVPVSYRLLSYSPDRAVVQIWGFTLLGNVSSVEPTAFFGLSRTVLAWSEGNWKIASTRASFGPTPRLASPRPGGEGLGLVELSEELRRYGVAP